MWVELILSSLAIGLSLAQTSYNNGLWTPSPTPSPSVWQPTTSEYPQPISSYQSWTTWTSMLVYGTVTVTVISTVPCPPTPIWVTTTLYTTKCDICGPVTTSYWYGYSTTSAPVITTLQQPVTTYTVGTVVYVVYGSTPAAAGQVTTNGVVQIVSAGASREHADLMRAGMAMAAATLLLALVGM